MHGGEGGSMEGERVREKGVGEERGKLGGRGWRGEGGRMNMGSGNNILHTHH